ncbi:helix-turn-helix transcriptional regulator [Marimonas lutisalis]|uniref:helix-turn-helix transcriptional regulator n=1 Tax=Marimonas lutisalis TaxID=2545756 RepID=UPI001F1E044B|nr:hypothetical protein [Marimonas lutisalis]
MENRKRISANAVRILCGDVSDMTLWRWLNDPAMNFPKPFYIARRRYWREADILAWLDAQEASEPETSDAELEVREASRETSDAAAGSFSELEAQEASKVEVAQ